MLRTFRTHHVFLEEEREQVVRAYLNSGDTIGETAKRYGVSERSLNHWLKKHRQGAASFRVSVSSGWRCEYPHQASPSVRHHRIFRFYIAYARLERPF